MWLNYHLALLGDDIRTRAFGKALTEIICPGDVVADFGTGTGVLAFQACKLKASRVYAIERGEVIQAAKALAERNGFSSQLVFIQGDAQEIELPEKVDVLMGEWLGCAGIDEQQLLLNEVAERVLKPNGTMLPKTLEVFCAPWAQPKNQLSLGQRLGPLWELDLGYLCEIENNRLHSLRLEPNHQISKAQRPWSFEFPNPTIPRQMEVECLFKVEKDALFAGLGFWFESQLSSSVRLSTAPDASPTHWKQGFLKIASVHPVKKGEGISIKLKASRFWDRMLLGYTGEIDRPGQDPISFESHMFFGETFSPSTFQARDGGAVSALSQNARVVMAFLAAVEEGLSFEEIVTRLKNQFPSCYPSFDLCRIHVGHMMAQWTKPGCF